MSDPVLHDLEEKLKSVFNKLNNVDFFTKEIEKAKVKGTVTLYLGPYCQCPVNMAYADAEKFLIQQLFALQAEYDKERFELADALYKTIFTDGAPCVIDNTDWTPEKIKEFQGWFDEMQGGVLRPFNKKVAPVEYAQKFEGGVVEEHIHQVVPYGKTMKDCQEKFPSKKPEWLTGKPPEGMLDGMFGVEDMPVKEILSGAPRK